MRARFIAILLAVVAPACAASITERLNEAKSLAQGGKTDAARVAFEGVSRDGTATTGEKASAHLALGQIELAAGKYAKCVGEAEQAAILFRFARDERGEGNALTVAGVAHIYAGEYPAALSALKAALELARKTGDAAGEVTRRNNIGNVYYFEGRYTDALDEYNSAYALVQAHPNETWTAARQQLTIANLASLYQRLGRYDSALNEYAALRGSGVALTAAEEAQLLANMGTLYRRLGDPVKALEAYHAAESLYQKQHLRTGEIAVLNNIGIAQALDMGRLPDALSSFNRSLELAEASGDRPVALHALLYRAETLLRMGEDGKADEGFENARARAHNLESGEEEWKALFGLARVAARRNDSALCVKLLRTAVAVIESLRGADPVMLRGTFLADKRDVYDLLIRELADGKRGGADEIFRLMELSRARTSQDLLKRTMDLTQVRAALGTDTLLIEYWIGDDALAAVWARRDQAGFIFQRTEPGLRARMRSFTASLKAPSGNDWQAVAAKIAQDLLDRLGAQFETSGIQKIVVSPDREAGAIPFEALPLSSRGIGRLIDRFTISYLPSGSLIEGERRGRTVVPFWSRTLLAFANPAPAKGKALIETAGLRRLPAAEEEIRDAAASVGGTSDLFFGAEALKTKLESNLRGRYPLVHLATHAFSDPEDPGRSFILFAAQGNAAWDYLFLNEISRLDFHGVRLVTLSACDTGAGKLVEGEGIAAFGRAFLNSGARAVTASLWPVGDRATAELMEIFYRNLAQGATAATALRDAKLEFARSQGHAHPFYWAGFVLNGDSEMTIPFVVRWPFLAAGGFVFAGVAALLFRLRATRGRKASAFAPHHLR